MDITVNKLEDIQLELVESSFKNMSPVQYKLNTLKVLCRQSTYYKILLLLIN